MSIDKNIEKFNYYEKLLFKTTLATLFISIALVFISYGLVARFAEIPDFLFGSIILLLLIAFFNFVLSLIRLFKFIVKVSGKEGSIGITRSVLGIFLNPTSILILMFTLFILALGSCDTF